MNALKMALRVMSALKMAYRVDFDPVTAVFSNMTL
jgi:hypothetical protein